eukprot:CAMPEP_0118952162 /NCGR_PEP_ID=MMETSP1169-20130426/54400_1 /TAXON_ID=36882 /ORGANISM="Pyramimonas obovata, Strain CCMP722" /LENGTH=464 /DNA_ID=CAMNT_0006899349 /DNA_START=218 /DNA_END=1609 /DNA_ORIENTATION=+
MAWPTLRSESLDALCAASYGPKTNTTQAAWSYQHLVGVCVSEDPLKIGNKYFGTIALRHVHQNRNADLMRKALLRKGRTDEEGSGTSGEARTTTLHRARVAFLEEGACRIGSMIEEDDAPDYDITDAYDRMAAEVTRRLALDPDVRAAESRAGSDSEVDYRPALRQLNDFLFGPPTDEEELERRLLDPRELPSTGGLGISGNREDYYSENNSSMRHVLKSRKGIPISLAVLQCCVGTRCGIPIDMVGIPCHFMTRCGRDDSPYECYSNNFDGGALLTRGAVIAMLGSMLVDYHPYLLRPTSEEDVLFRMCKNLMHVYNGPPCLKGKLLWTLNMALTLQPRNTFIRQLRSRVALACEQFDLIIADSELRAEEDGQAMLQRAVDLKAEQSAQASLQQRRPGAVTRQVTGHDIAPGDPEEREPQFHIGMQVLHTKHNFRGVVYQWDCKYVSNQEWLFSPQGADMEAW